MECDVVITSSDFDLETLVAAHVGTQPRTRTVIFTNKNPCSREKKGACRIHNHLNQNSEQTISQFQNPAVNICAVAYDLEDFFYFKHFYSVYRWCGIKFMIEYNNGSRDSVCCMR